MKTKTKDLQANITARKEEIYSYQVNINNYQAILDGITDEWDEDTAKFKNMTSEEIVKNVPSELMEKISDLVFKDKIKTTIEIEKLEQRKSKHVLDALKKQLEG